MICVGLLGLVLYYTWNRLILQYKSINHYRFRIIHEMEKQLPFACYTKEWEYYLQDQKYQALTQIEKQVPFILSLPYLFLVMFGLGSLIWSWL